jgi:Leucine-rich repeat (LRR) protein
MKKLLLILLCLPMIGFGQPTVNIPDANFKAYLVGEPLINTNGDSEIQQSEATAFNGTISCYYMNISDLTGIENFTALTTLFCYENQLTSLDVSQNTALTTLFCDFNQLTSLDVSGATDLYFLQCQSNQLTSLDVRTNTALQYLYCYSNQLTSLDVRNGNNVNFAYFNATVNPNLSCISVDDTAWSTTNWTVSNLNIDTQHYFSNNCPPSAIEEHTTNKELLKVTDLLGRETKGTKNEPLFYIYDDGTVEKKIILK